MLGKFLFKYVRMYIAFPLFVRMSKKLFAIYWNSVLPLHFFPWRGKMWNSVDAILVLSECSFYSFQHGFLLYLLKIL